MTGRKILGRNGADIRQGRLMDEDISELMKCYDAAVLQKILRLPFRKIYMKKQRRI